MAKISISLSDELVDYLNAKVDDRSALIELLLTEWQQQQEKEALADAFKALDKLELGWTEECQQAAITDWEESW